MPENNEGFGSPLLNDLAERSAAQDVYGEAPEVLADTIVTEEVQDGLPVGEEPVETEPQASGNYKDWPEEQRQQHEAALKGMNKAQEEAAALRKKGELLDRLNADPAALKKYLEAVTTGETEPESPQGPTGSSWDGTNPHSDFDFENWEEDTLTGIDARIMTALTEKMLPMLQPYRQAVEQMFQQNQRSTWDGLVAKHPALEGKQAEVQDMISRGLTEQQAINAVGGSALLEPRAQNAPSQEPTQKPTDQPAPVSLAKSSGRIPKKSRRAIKDGNAVLGVLEDMKALGAENVGELFSN